MRNNGVQEYVPKEKNEDGSPSRPVIIHRAILGSVERMMAILIENYNGKWPFWLCPRQACVIPTHPEVRGLRCLCAYLAARAVCMRWRLVVCGAARFLGTHS